MKKEYPDILKLEGEKWHNPDPATGKLGTRVPAEWLQTTEDSLKSLTLEMLEVLKSAGINPNELNNTQVRDAIQKMILARVINYNDIQGRPVVKDSLGDDRNNPASQRVVNDVNRDVVTAQKTANNAHALAQTKQDKLPFVGDGPDVLKAGAYGLASTSSYLIDGDWDDLFPAPKSGFYRFAKNAKNLPDKLGEYDRYGLWFPYHVSNYGAFLFVPYGASSSRQIVLRTKYESLLTDYYFYTDQNTTADKSGFLRSSGNVNALTESDKTNSYGSSKTLVATQYLVNETAQKATNAHYRADEAYEAAVGTSRKWIDVTSQRSPDTTYINSSDKYIFVSVLTYHRNEGSSYLTIDGEEVAHEGAAIGGGSNNNLKAYLFTFIPPGSQYKVRSKWIEKWMELR